MPAANERPSLLGRPTVPSEQSTGAGAAPAAAWPADPGLPGGVLPAGSLADAPPASSPAGLPSARPNGAAPAAPQAATRAVRAAIATDPGHGAVVPPLHLSATFAFAGFGLKGAYDYTRSGNPTRDQLAAAIAELEGGAGAVVTASGMAAITLAVHLLEPGELLVAPHDCYGGTHRLFKALAGKRHFRVEFVDQRDARALAAALTLGPRMVWIETPSNPLLRITDIATTAAQARAAGALVVADNTFLSPALQRPLELGADLVVHSTTKYLNGHSDVVGGAVVARDAVLHEALVWWANCLGLTGAPFDSFLTLRGLRTLFARMALHLENAAAAVEALRAHPAVARVYYPGLPDHPGHEIAARQQAGYGAMVSFELEGGEPAVQAFVEGLSCFTLAESLGGVESLVAHPATMTHASMDAAARREAGITDGLLRLSVGIEDRRDVVADLEAALDRALRASRRARPAGTGSSP
jgi:cystathionine gamma-synthase